MSETTREEDFFDRFFGDGNLLDQDKRREELAPWLDRVIEGKPRLVLPRAQGKPAVVTWYALCQDARDARAFREELLAAVGPSYSDFYGVGATLDPTDPVDAAVLAFSGPHGFKLTVVDRSQTGSCNAALQRMLALHDHRPLRTSVRRRSRGRVLMDFRLALRQRDFERANQALAELHEHGHLDAWNLLFLRIQLWEVNEDWTAILSEIEDSSLVELRRPRRVTQALLRAIYNQHIRAFEKEFDPDSALRTFQNHLWTPYQGLIRSKAGMSGHEIASLFMLKAAIEKSGELRDRVLEAISLEPRHKAWVEALAELVVPTATSTGAAGAPLLKMMVSDPDQAFEKLLKGAGGELRVPLMLRCAADIGSLSSAQLAIEALYALPSGEADDIRKQAFLARRITELEELCTSPAAGESPPSPPSDWLDWIERLDDGQLDENQSHLTAQRGAQEWSRSDFARRPGDVRQFAGLLAAHRADELSEQIRLALPFMVEFFLPDGPLDPTFRPVFRALGQRLAFEDLRSKDVLRMLAEVTDATIRAGVDAKTHREVCEELSELVLQPGLGTEHVEWALDLLESLCTLGSPDPTSVHQVASNVYAYIQHWGDRVSRTSKKLFNSLASEFSLGMVVPIAPPEPSQATSEKSFADALAEKTIAMYSLNAGALRRVKSALKEESKDATVLLFSDKHGGSRALREAARSSDLFVIVTASATHSATEFIESHRSSVQMTLRHHAKGSASLVREIRGYLLEWS